MAFSTVRLGTVDRGAAPPDPAAYFQRIHEGPMIRNAGTHFRGEANGVWVPFQTADARPVAELQTFLRDAGFAPHAHIDGICGYRTTSAVRLFQEYVRSVEKDDSIGVPDGIAGSNTAKHIERWKRGGLRADWSGRADREYPVWMDLLARVKRHYEQNPAAVHERVAAYSQPSDTRPPAEWDFSPDRIHLVGIRRNESAPPRGKRRTDDGFALLVNGSVFKFFGTTDPGTTTNSRGAPFLVHGQHAYRFGWHKQSDKQKVYRALKPRTSGVLVIRDGDRDFALSAAEDAGGAVERNASINVHWGGRGGTAGWSAGCQVICGRAYINHRDEVVDCSDFAASGYGSLGQRTSIGR